MTAVALLHLLEITNHNVDEPFYPFIKNKVGDINTGVKTVTLKNLLTMKERHGCRWKSKRRSMAVPYAGPATGARRYPRGDRSILKHELYHPTGCYK